MNKATRFSSLLRLSLALSLPLLGGCKMLQTIALASPDERLPNPSFVVTSEKGANVKPKYDTVYVVDPEGELIWHLRAEPFTNENASRRLSYGRPLPGFATVVDAKPLEPGKTYQMQVSGPALGSLDFRSDQAGRVRPVD